MTRLLADLIHKINQEVFNGLKNSGNHRWQRCAGAVSAVVTRSNRTSGPGACTVQHNGTRKHSVRTRGCLRRRDREVRAAGQCT